MVFTPDSEVYLLTNVPLNNTYANTMTFGSKASQSSYFLGKTLKTYENVTYQRMDSLIRVPDNAENLWQANYLMYRNTNYGTKWFYAFITKIEYRNPNETNIYFEIDVYQTWMFNIEIKPSFVVREHVDNDSIGAHTLPEDVELGEFVEGSSNNSGVLNELVIVVGATTDAEGINLGGGEYGGVYSGLDFYAFTSTTALETFLKDYTENGQANAIVGITMLPSFMTGGVTSGKIPKSNTAYFDKFTVPSRPNTIDGYTPKNNKLFTYPYCYLRVYTPLGTNAVYRYELLNQNSPNIFNVAGVTSLDGVAFCYPANYAGSSTPYNYGISISNFPSCSWSTDTFVNSFAQKKLSFSLGVVSSAMPDLKRAATNPVGELLGSAGRVTNQIVGLYESSLVPPQASGNIGSGDIFVGLNRLDFFYQTMSIRSEYARVVDGYFSKFGYRVNSLKIPNVTGRPSWNFVQTIDAEIVGDAPVDDIRRIKQMFDNGVTFWHGDYVGDYSRGNEV